MPSDPPIESLNEQFVNWSRQRSLAEGLDSGLLEKYETANPSWMTSYGIQRYWRKHRLEQSGIKAEK